MKKLFSILLCFVLLFTGVIGCSNNDDPITDETPEVESGPQIEIVEGKYFLKNKISDYKILVQNKEDKDNSIESYAGGEFQAFFSEATGAILPIITDNAEIDVNGKYISIGDTTVSNSSVVEGTNNDQAFCIKNSGDSIVVVGNSNYGTLWGVYELLSIMLNYEYYAADTYYIDTNVVDLPYFTINYTDEPDLEYRATGDGQSYTDLSVSRRFRYLKSDREFFLVNGSWCHNSFYYFGANDHDDAEGIRTTNSDYYIDPANKEVGAPHYFISTHNKQLCYTAHGNEQALNAMVDIAASKIIEIANASSGLNHIMIGMQDGDNQWCACDACKAAELQYGAHSGAVVNFCNKVYEKIVAAYNAQTVDRIINISFFAYNKTEPAPVKNGEATIRCAEGVSVMLAPIFADWSLPFNDTKNQTYYQMMVDWGKACDSIFLWAYHTNYKFFLYPYDCFNNIYDNYRLFAEECKVKFIFNQGKHKLERATAFTTLGEYLMAKLSWDLDADVEALTNNYFEQYFGPAAETMKTFYNQMRTLLITNQTFNETSGWVYSELLDLNNVLWPEATVMNWLDLIDKAYQDIASLENKNPTLYKKYYDHINLESIMPRVIYLDNIDIDYSVSREEMVKKLLNDCEYLHVSYYSEGETMSEHFS